MHTPSQANRTPEGGFGKAFTSWICSWKETGAGNAAAEVFSVWNGEILCAAIHGLSNQILCQITERHGHEYDNAQI